MVGVNIKVDGGQGGNTTSDASKYLKEMAFIMRKTATLGQAGLGGGGLAGILGALSGGGYVAAIAAIVAAVTTFNKSREPGDSGYNAPAGESMSYKEIYVDGDKQIAKINNETEQIVDILTIQQAQQMGVVDENEKVLGNLKTNNDVWTDITKDMERYKGTVNLTNDEANIIKAYSTKIGESLTDIDEENAKWFKSLAGENGIVLSMEEAAETSRSINSKLKQYLNSIPSSYSSSKSSYISSSAGNPVEFNYGTEKGQGTYVPSGVNPDLGLHIPSTEELNSYNNGDG